MSPSWARSGSGKTTLLNILAALDTPDGGRGAARRAGPRRDPRERDRARSAATISASCFRSSTCLTPSTLEDNIYLPLVLAGKTYERDAAAACCRCRETLGIARAAEKVPLRGLRRAEAARRRGPRAHHEAAHPAGRRADRRARLAAPRTSCCACSREINRRGQTILMVTHSVKAASHAGPRAVHPRRRGVSTSSTAATPRTGSLIYQRISDTLTMLAARR